MYYFLTLEVTWGNFQCTQLELIVCIVLKEHCIANNYPRKINEISLFCCKKDPV